MTVAVLLASVLDLHQTASVTLSAISLVIAAAILLKYAQKVSIFINVTILHSSNPRYTVRPL